MLGALVLALLVLASKPIDLLAMQGMPAPVFNDLLTQGHPKLAQKISKMLEVRSHPDSAEVQNILNRWELEADGPESSYDYLTVTRLWLKAGQASEAELALRRTVRRRGAKVPAGLVLLDQARVAYLARDYVIADAAYWRGCKVADQATSIEYWLDIENLATPEEVDEWERFATLPPHERRTCAFLRAFWNERAAASAVTVSRRVAQHYQRLRYVRQRYLRRSGKKGPSFSNRIGRPVNSIVDDRGLVYLRMGEPDRRTSYLAGECFQSNESWAYYYPEETRIYHFSAGAGVDDWWLIDNLADVYICGNPGAGMSPVNTVGPFIPGASPIPVFNELYASRSGLDSRYMQWAFDMKPGNPLRFQQAFGHERNRTYADAEFAIDSVPERPAVDVAARLMVEDLQFRSSAVGKTRVWLNGLIEAKRLTPLKLADGSLKYEVEAVYSLIDSRDRLIQGRQLFETTSDDKLGDDESIPVRIPLRLQPGDYRYTLMVRSTARKRGKQPVGNYRRDVLTVHEYDATVPQLSSVAVAPDSGGTWTVGGGVFIKPSPAHNTGTDKIAHIYYEAYGLTPRGEFVTTVHMDPESSGQEFTLEFRRVSGPNPAEPTRGYLRLDLQKTPPGVYKMDVVVTDAATGTSTLPVPLDILVNKK